MNGTIYDEIKKNGESKKREKLKFFTAIITTNLLVAILCLSFGGPSPASSTKVATRILHPHFKMIIVPLTVLIDIDPGARETAISLMTKSKKILIRKAYLHEEVKKTDGSTESLPRFKIEIPEDEVMKISADSEVEMIAIPEIKLTSKHNSTTNKRVSHYEVNL